jgi:hypothetical protein
MHYDLDGRAVLLTQVFGRKRVWVVSPANGQRLDPMVEPIGHWSSLFIENLSPEAKLELAHSIGAFDTVLEPGDTIFIPTGWWHYVDYIETGMSFNIRIGRTPRQRALFAVAERLLPRHMHYWQGIAQLFATGRAPSADECAALDRLLGAFARAAGGDPERVAEFGSQLVELYRHAQPTGYRDILHRNDLARSAPIEALAAPPPDPGVALPRPPAAWSDHHRVALAPRIEIAQSLGREELILLQDGEPSWRIGADSMPESFALVRRLFAQVSTGPEPVAVAELARRLACDPEQLIDLLDELSETGALVAAEMA